MNKIYIDANSLLIHSFELAKKIYDSNYKPDVIIGVWRGGSPTTLAIDEYFRFKGIKIPSFPLKSEAYSGINKINKEVKLFGLTDLINNIKNIEKKDNLLIVDDVLESGTSLEEITSNLSKFFNNIKIATIYYKPKRNKTELIPDYYLHEVEDWIVFPHELENLSLNEIRSKNLKLYRLLTTKKLIK